MKMFEPEKHRRDTPFISEKKKRWLGKVFSAEISYFVIMLFICIIFILVFKYSQVASSQNSFFTQVITWMANFLLE